MALKKYFALALAFIAALFLDTAVLPKWNLFHLVPFVMFALMLAAERLFSLQDAILIGAFGGLLEDILCENMIGLTSALCLLAAVAFHQITQKNELKPAIAGLLFAALAFLLEAARALAAYVIGMRFSVFGALVYGAFPRAILTGLWGLLFLALFRPLLKGQVDSQ